MDPLSQMTRQLRSLASARAKNKFSKKEESLAWPVVLPPQGPPVRTNFQIFLFFCSASIIAFRSIFFSFILEISIKCFKVKTKLKVPLGLSSYIDTGPCTDTSQHSLATVTQTKIKTEQERSDQYTDSLAGKG